MRVVVGNRIRLTIRQGLFRRHAVRDHVLAIRSPFRTAAEVAMLADALETGAIRVNHIEIDELETLPSAVSETNGGRPIRREGNPSSIRRPRRPKVAARS